MKEKEIKNISETPKTESQNIQNGSKCLIPPLERNLHRFRSWLSL